ncbi:MAG: hydrogenase maturation nickel metallochaperone HypA [Candidatus Aenigmarchaeota archaeon]|nr:hydrogenase maturation nickel metallochaperone HypA [Candidatus Aenigmarchaeota archaeon]
MHEYPITMRIVETVIGEAEKRKAKKVKEVKLIIGRLAVLGIEQVKFYFGLLTKETIMEGSKLTIEEEDPIVECEKCGYKGNIQFDSKDAYHFLYLP